MPRSRPSHGAALPAATHEAVAGGLTRPYHGPVSEWTRPYHGPVSERTRPYHGPAATHEAVADGLHLRVEADGGVLAAGRPHVAARVVQRQRLRLPAPLPRREPVAPQDRLHLPRATVWLGPKGRGLSQAWYGLINTPIDLPTAPPPPPPPPPPGLAARKASSRVHGCRGTA